MNTTWDDYFKEIEELIEQIRYLAEVGMIDPDNLRVALDTIRDEAQTKVYEIYGEFINGSD
ncbi:hypothetical protein Ab1vBOLIVR5_gp140 [Agrobacterium phage OLIVR5]|uniref:Uncharacterized protein n=2 Tax=Caudoviricetes TaxID=2731619 RepID=A0A858MT63_9CAUD|nr:hypothetical protein KNU99_gp140 [Agrobacterium phage OLIVR5]QIW87788.1 hypothetical protein Ab1vBOLIVR5_gp140 [Agrobacterium phage OLIVR5]QIW88053.1 hypothetical protein Ab1vBOLIVR6_gp146 [Agrobacterium phage OLIVR6]